LAGATFVASFSIFITTLKHFIYRKIKIIYKTIFDFKNTKDTVLKEKLDLKKDILQNTENDVKQWIEEKSHEIIKLKEQEKFRREFLANVSHELRTPIFNVQGYIETLIDGGLNDNNIRIDYLQKALKNITRLNSIISDLEKISHLERGQTIIELSEFEIKPLVQEVFDLLTYSAQKKNIKLGFKKSCTLNATVKADREKIKEVLINLVSNAINYGNNGGKVLVGCYDMENKILVEVSDDGIGIEKKHLPYIFNRFYRVDKTRSRMEGGTGLGLSIVKHIIEAHNQVINVRSTPGQGSTFGFTLDKSK
jgi:two-component system phosphate regulon sensor histidine kinase PhoR